MAQRGPTFVKTSVVIVIAALLLTVLIAGCAEEPEAPASPMPDMATTSDPEPEQDAPEPVDDGGATGEAAEGQAAEGQPEDDQAPADGAGEAADADTEGDEQAATQQAGEGTENVKTIIKLHTGKGTMTAELYDEDMPITAGNFLLLIDKGFYKNMTFHRVVPDFVIQGGDPTGTGSGGPDWAIPLEKPGAIHHETGILSMARAQPLDSAGSQFFVCLSNNDSVQALDSLGGGYAAFGKVTEGMDVAQRIAVGDSLEKIEIISESEHADAAREASLEARLPAQR